jgi:hypothetical protein
MNSRGDGRIEPGQPINTAISARAWNRAQDAADIVLGTTPSFLTSESRSSPRFLTMPMLITSSFTTTTTFPPGSVVTFDIRANQTTARRTSGTLGTALTPPYGDYFEMPSAKALLHEPNGVTPLVAPATTLPWGVTVEGGTKNQSIVNVIVRGVAPVRIRSMTYRGGPNHFYACPAIRRSAQETLAQLTGILETTECACDNAAQIVFMDGSTSATTGGAETAEVFWGLVVI